MSMTWSADHRILVMFDDEHGVSKASKPFERLEQPVIVLLVKTNGGFVEDIEDTRQTRANLARETNTLAFATAKRAARPVEVKIVEPDIMQEAKPLVDFLQDRAGDFTLGRSELVREAAKPGMRVGNTAATGHADVLAGDLHAERFRLETGTVTHFAGPAGLVTRQLLSHPGRFRLEHSAIEIADDAFERLLHFVASLAVNEAQGNRFAPRAVKDDVARLVGKLRPGSFEIEVVRAGEACRACM